MVKGKMKDFQTKNAPLEFKLDSEKRTIEGHAAIFGNVDSDVDIIEKGAFAETIKDRMPRNLVKMLWQHREPLGRIEHLAEDSKGLSFRGRISKTSLGDDALVLIKDGVVDRMSIGFRVADSTFEDQKGEDGILHSIRHITKVDPLYEVSPVTFAANEATSITGIKGITELLRYFEQPSVESKDALTFGDLELGDRDASWDADSVIKRLREWAGAEEEPNEKYAKAFLWVDEKNTDNFGAYKLPIADVVEDDLKAMPRALFSAAAALQGARGGVDIPNDDISLVKDVVSKYYEKMRSSLDDDSISPPWEKSNDWIANTVELLYNEITIPGIVTSKSNLDILTVLNDEISSLLATRLPAEKQEDFCSVASYATDKLNELVIQLRRRM